MTIGGVKLFVDGIRLPGVVNVQFDDDGGTRTAKVLLHVDSAETNDGVIRIITTEHAGKMTPAR